MRPLKIIATDFLPFRGKVEVDLSDVHAATVTGKNGTGKSSFFVDASLFALFGQARKRPEGLINDLSTTMSVDLFFQHREQFYLVKRSIEHTKQQILKFYQIGSGGKEDLSERLLTETQKKLDEVLGISYGLLLSTSIAQQEDINRLFNLKPSERQDMIMEMLSLDYWVKKKAAISKHLKDSDALDAKIEGAETELAVAEGQVEVLREALTLQREKREPLIVNKGERKKQVMEKQAEAGVSADRQKLQTEYDTLSGKLEGREERLKELKKLPDKRELVGGVEKLIEDNKDIDKIINDICKNYEALTDQRAEVQAKILNVVSLMGRQENVKILTKVPCINTDYYDRCQLLSQGKATQKEITKYLQGLSGQFASLEDVKVSFEERVTKINQGLKRLDDANKIAVTRGKDTQVEMDEANSMIKDIDAGLELSKSTDVLRDQVETVRRRIVKLPEFDIGGLIQLQHELEDITKTISTIDTDIATKDKELELTLKVMAGIEAALETLRIEETRIASYQILNQAYGDIPAHLFGETIPHIEEYANEILAKIDPLKRIQLRPFKETKGGTQKKSLDVVGWTGTGLRDIENLSGSERFRQGLALRVALARVNSEMYNTQIGFFIVDEGFGSLDPENVEAVKDVLREVAKQFDLFLVITHIEELKDTFDQEIHIETHKDGSVINILKH